MTTAARIRKAATKVREARGSWGDGRQFHRLTANLLDQATLADLLETEADEVERTGRVKPNVWQLAQDIEGYDIV